MKHIAWLCVWLYKHFTETPGLKWLFTGWLWCAKASKRVQRMMLVLGVSREPRKCPEVWLTVPRLPPLPVYEKDAQVKGLFQVKGLLSLESKEGWNSWKTISQFPVAAITDNHQFSGSKQRKSIILQFCNSEAWNGSHWAGIKMLAGRATFFSEDSRGESVFFPASRYCPCF